MKITIDSNKQRYGEISNLPLQNASGTKMKMKQAVSSYLINVK